MKFFRDDGGYRNENILGIVPYGVESVLDIGCRDNIFRGYDVTTLDVVDDGFVDVVQDLDKVQRLPFSDDSFDLVVVNQVLEHLNRVEVLISEIKRVSRKYVFIGLPNELTFSSRIKYFFGIPNKKGYQPYGHKHFFIYSEIEKFVNDFFGGYESKAFFYACSGAKLVPRFLKKFLSFLYPSLFASELYYLVDLEVVNYE